MAKRDIDASLISGLVAVCGFIMLLAIGIKLTDKEIEKKKQAYIQNSYASALDYLAEGKYESALSCLSSTEGYENSAALMLYANAAQAFDLTDSSGCELAYAYCDAFPMPYAGPYAKEMQALKAEVSVQKAAYDTEQKELAAAQAEAEKAQYLVNLRGELPHVGMSEEYIDQTSLGAHSSASSSSEMRDGKKCPSTIYRWFRGGASTCVFVANVMDGQVISAYKLSKATYWNERYPVQSVKTSSAYSAPKKRKAKPKEDPYNAADYIDPDDFYFDYYDDFWDFEDAEDYWREHN